MSMNERVIQVVRDQADAFYEGQVSSAEAFHTIDMVSGSAWNYYPGIINDTREAFDARVTANIDRDVDEKRQLNYAASEVMRQVKRGPYEGEDFFRVQVSGNGQTRHFNATAEQLRSFAMALDTDAPPSAFEV